MNAQPTAHEIETFVGFWPFHEYHGELDVFELENDIPTVGAATQLRETLRAYNGHGWKMVVCADYLCLIHLEEFEEALAVGRQCHDLESPDLFRGTLAAWPAYVQALNAWNFLLFAACHTGRGHSFMHDFEELSVRNCARILYKVSGEPIRHANYGRNTDAHLRRFRERVFKTPPSYMKVDRGIFDDAASYWGTISKGNLVQLAALGGKLISEHRMRNHRTAVALAWFELEAWAIDSIRLLGFRATTRKGKERLIKEMIDEFPAGTSIANIRDDLHTLREIRNGIAHRNMQVTHSDSVLALRCFIKMLNVRSGLALRIDDNPAPTSGL